MNRLRFFTPILIFFIYLMGYNVSDNVSEYKISTSEVIKYDEGLKGMIVPHHLLANDIIENMYYTASNDDVKTILLISPDHFPNERRFMFTSKVPWMTEFGKLFISDTVDDFNIPINDKEVQDEHGLYVHMPYIKKYFKNAKVIPIAISKETNITELNRIVDNISEDTFVIASVDFSHYLDLKTANDRDAYTRKLFDISPINFFNLNDEYFDSAPSLYLIFTWADKMGYKHSIYDNRNSFMYCGNPDYTTSYFIIGFK